MEDSPELTRLAIRIANTAASGAEANELCRQTALSRNLSTTRYARLLLEVAYIQTQLGQMICAAE